MRLITRLLLGLIAVVATLFITAAFAVNTIDPAQHKDRIQQFVFDQTGRSLEINGRVEAQLFPWPGVSLQNVTLAGAEGFYTENFANVEHVETRVRFLPLLVGNVRIKHVHLRGLELDLQRNLEGRTNWDDLMSNTSVVTTNVSNDDVLQEIEAGTPVVAALSVGQLVVSDSIIHWRDEMAEDKFFLSGFRLSADEVRLTEPFRFETAFVVNGVAGMPTTHLKASGLAGLDLAENIYRVDSLKVDSVLTFTADNSLEGPSPERAEDSSAARATSEQGREPATEKGTQDTDRRLTARYTGSVIADLNAQRVDFSPLSLAVEGIVLTGELHVTDLLQDPGVFGYVASEPVDVAALLDKRLTKISQKSTKNQPESQASGLPQMFDRSLLQGFEFSARFRRAEENFLVNDVRLGNQHAELTGNFQVTNFQRAPVLTGTITSNNINPALWAESIGFTAVDKTALKQARIRADVRQSGQLLVLNDIDFKLDDSTVSGDIEFVKTKDGQYPVHYELHADSVNFDRYFRTGVDVDGLLSVTRGPTRLPVEMINSMDFQGALTATKVQWSGLQFTDVSLPVRIADGRVEGLEVKATAYKGTLFGTTVLDVTPEEPLLTATVSLNAVDLEPMMTALLQRESLLSGTGIVNMDLLSRGSTVAEMADRAGGALNIRLTDGAISSVNLANSWVSQLSTYLLPDAIDKIESSTTADGTAGDTARTTARTTALDELSMSWELADGRLYSDDLELRTPGMSMAGRGSFDIEQQLVDYLLQVAIEQSDGDNAIDDIDSPLAPTHNRMVGMTVPLEIRGAVEPLANDFIGRLNESFRLELQRPDIFGKANAEDARPQFDIDVVKDRLAQHNAEAEAAISARLAAMRDTAQQLQEQQKQKETAQEEIESTNTVNEEIQRETEELKSRLQQNLQKDLKRNVSTLSED